jgi:hypothetical protein
LEIWPGRPARILCRGAEGVQNRPVQSHPVAPSQASQSQKMEQKLTKRTKLNSLALTWNQGRSPSLPSRPSVQIPACSLPAARISRISGPMSAGRSSQSNQVALSRTQSGLPEMQGKSSHGSTESRPTAGAINRSLTAQIAPYRSLFFWRMAGKADAGCAKPLHE